MVLRWDEHVNRSIDTKITFVVLVGKPLESDQILDQKDQKILTQMLQQFISYHKRIVCKILIT
jgi:hypothetical protein